MASLKRLLIVCANLALLRLIGAHLLEPNSTSQLGSIGALDKIDSLDFSRPPAPAPEAANASSSRPTIERRARAKSAPNLAELVGNFAGQLERAWRASSTRRTHKEAKLNGSALAAEGANLLSVTKQLVRLARDQRLLGREAADHLLGAAGLHSSWSSPPPPPSVWPGALLAAASGALHDSLALEGHQHHSQHAMAKSDWLWFVAPAVICIGAAVIVVPLIAAYLVSNAMAQNTFSVSAGRRRRKRHAPLASEHSTELLGLLDPSALLGETPLFLVQKLAHLHGLLEHLGAHLAAGAPESLLDDFARASHSLARRQVASGVRGE